MLFPHHENERAQATACQNRGFARIWMHHGLLTIDGRKMSKSLNNFVTLEDVLKRHSLDAIKLFFLQSHYRSDIDFTWVRMKACEEAIRSFYLFFEKTASMRNSQLSKTEEQVFNNFSKVIDDGMRQDFDTPKAISTLFLNLRSGNEILAKNHEDTRAWTRAKLIFDKSRLFGLFGQYRVTGAAETPWKKILDELVSLRNVKRKAKRYEVSDYIRGELLKMGFEAEDRVEDSQYLRLNRNREDKIIVEKLNRLLEDVQKMEEGK